MPSTARGAFPFPVGSDTPDVPRDITAIANRMAAVGCIYLQGTLAARPAANSQGGGGILYFATDNGLLYYSDGAAWTQVSPATSSTALIDAVGAESVDEGVIDQASGLVTYLDSSHIRIAAGSGWIRGDGVAGVGSGLYRVSWPQTDIAVPAVTNTRMDMVIIRLTGQHGSIPSVELLTGTDVAGVTFANYTGQPLLPSGCMRLADVLMPLTSSTVRDRRMFARGYTFSYFGDGSTGDDAGAGGNINFSNGSFAYLDSVRLLTNFGIHNGARIHYLFSCDLSGVSGLQVGIGNANGVAGIGVPSGNGRFTLAHVTASFGEYGFVKAGIRCVGSATFIRDGANSGKTMAFSIREEIRPQFRQNTDPVTP